MLKLTNAFTDKITFEFDLPLNTQQFALILLKLLWLVS